MPTSQKQLIAKYGIPNIKSIAFNKNFVLWDVPEYINKQLPAIPNRIYCNKDLVRPLEIVYLDLIEAFHARKLTKLDSIITYDGCFNIRKISGSNALSTHSWAIAIDHNAFRNGLGQTPTFSETYARIWEKRGFEWGGRWKRPDGMHAQLDFSKIDIWSRL